MEYLNNELKRCQRIINSSKIHNLPYMLRYAVQQILSWVDNPIGFKFPIDKILEGKIQAKDIREGSIDYSVLRNQLQSLDIYSRDDLQPL